MCGVKLLRMRQSVYTLAGFQRLGCRLGLSDLSVHTHICLPMLICSYLEFFFLLTHTVVRRSSICGATTTASFASSCRMKHAASKSSSQRQSRASTWCWKCSRTKKQSRGNWELNLSICLQQKTIHSHSVSASMLGSQIRRVFGSAPHFDLNQKSKSFLFCRALDVTDENQLAGAVGNGWSRVAN